MAKAYCYCPKCKKMLTQVLSSFECLSTWDKAEGYYTPGNECKLVNRCPDCGTLTKEKERKIHRGLKKKTGEGDVRPPHFKKRLKETRTLFDVEVQGEDHHDIQSHLKSEHWDAV